MTMNDTVNKLDEADAVKTILQRWIDSFPKTASASREFNLFSAASGNLNENAHTRILAALLRIKPVRSFFFAYLDRKYPHRGLAKILDACDEPASVRCFENHLDACVAVGRFRIVIENKAKGACDQPEQIDRYVDTIKDQGVDGEAIFVLYVTQNGGFPGDGSFKRAKDILECKGNGTGRLFALSYLQDILPWLREMLDQTTWNGLAEPDRDMLKSGLLQYVNYIEGQNLLGLREEKDGYEDFRKGVLKDLSGWTFPNIMTACTVMDFLLLREREHLYRTLDESRFSALGRKTKQWLLKTILYRAFHVAVPDESFYVQIPVMVNNTDDMVAAAGLWEDTADSVVQVDIWCANEISRTYDDVFNHVFERAEELHRCKRMTWNGKEMIRFRVSTQEEMCAVVQRLGGKLPRKVETASSGGSALGGRIDCDEFLRQIRAAVNNLCSRERISFSDGRWELWGDLKTEDGRMWANHRYSYVNGWAIQLHESPGEAMRALDVFARREKASEDVSALQEQMSKDGFESRAMRWDGRVFYRFPLPNREYAEKLLCALWKWRTIALQ